MLSSTDHYVTRTDQPRNKFPRLDPVVYSRKSSSASSQQRGPLSKDQLDEYNNNGFLFFPGFFPEQVVAEFLNDLRAYDEDEAFKRQPQVITEPSSDEIRSIFGVHRLSERFDRLTKQSYLLDIAHQILDSDVYIHQSRINYKPGFVGNGFNWHSDFETWHSEDGMPRMRCFSISILLAENNAHNGPLMLIPGSHHWFLPTTGLTPDENWRKSLKSQTLGVPPANQLRELTDRGGLAVPTGPAGSLILFECNTMHASTNNYSPWPRSNLFFVYNSVENMLEQPFCGTAPRPEFIASRENVAQVERISMVA